MKDAYKLTVYLDKRGEYRWRITHVNGNTIADGSEGYVTRSNAIRAARRLKVIAGEAVLVK